MHPPSNNSGHDGNDDRDQDADPERRFLPVDIQEHVGPEGKDKAGGKRPDADATEDPAFLQSEQSPQDRSVHRPGSLERKEDEEDEPDRREPPEPGLGLGVVPARRHPALDQPADEREFYCQVKVPDDEERNGHVEEEDHERDEPPRVAQDDRKRDDRLLPGRGDEVSDYQPGDDEELLIGLDQVESQKDNRNDGEREDELQGAYEVGVCEEGFPALRFGSGSLLVRGHGSVVRVRTYTVLV